jgi:choline dehydrogenase
MQEGKTLVGCSALNYEAYHRYAIKSSPLESLLMFDRPTVDSFQRWANAVGDDSYLRDNVLPFYKDSAKFIPPNNLTRFANSTLTFLPAAFNNSLNGPV